MGRKKGKDGEFRVLNWGIRVTLPKGPVQWAISNYHKVVPFGFNSAQLQLGFKLSVSWQNLWWQA